MPTNSFSGEVRRRVAYGRQAGATSLKVPLHAAPEGDWREGHFDVPARLAGTQPDTNERHEFEGVVRENFKRWCGWLEKRGWEYVVGSLQVDGPYDKPTETAQVEGDAGVKEYHLLARFRRNTPLYVGLDDMLAIREMAQTYEVPEVANPLPWNDVRAEDTGWVNPLTFAEERRKKLGLKRDEYLFGPLWEPL